MKNKGVKATIAFWLTVLFFIGITDSDAYIKTRTERGSDGCQYVVITWENECGIQKSLAHSGKCDNHLFD